MQSLHIGTSGYSYSYWKNRFYPDKLPASKWLDYYSQQFNTVEINNTFYRFPQISSLTKAAERTPDNFMFSVKAHKIITHTLRMKNARQKIEEFTQIVTEGLGKKLACILYQLPPSFHYSDERLEDIINNIPAGKNQIIEFRHQSWWQDKVYEALTKHCISFCSVSYPGLPDTNIITTSTFYKRMHGVPELFASSYDMNTLEQLATNIPSAREIYVYFNNTMYEAGYTNALSLKRLLTNE